MDEKIRELERRYAESNSADDAQALLNARLRAGEPSNQLLMRYLARILVGREPDAQDLLAFLDEKIAFTSFFEAIRVVGDSALANNSEIENLEQRLHNLESQL